MDPANPAYPKAGEKVESGSVFTVNYVKDNSQTQPTNYTIKYMINGEEQKTDTITVEGTAWINDNPAKIAIAESGIPTPADKYKGYKLDPANPAYPKAGEKVESGSVFTVNYVKDNSQTQLTSYTIKYTINGEEQPADAVTVEGSAWINDDPAMIKITEGGISAPADKYTGYKLDEKNPKYPEAGAEVESGSVFTVNYVSVPVIPDAVTPVNPTQVNPIPSDQTPTIPSQRITPSDQTSGNRSSSKDNDGRESYSEDIQDGTVPLVGFDGGVWALLNLILTVATVLLSLILLIGCFGKKKKNEEEETEDDEETQEKIRKKKFWRILSLIPAIGAVIAFILTEDMRLDMVIIDRWTLLMAVIALVQIILAVFSKKSSKEEENEEDSKADLA